MFKNGKNTKKIYSALTATFISVLVSSTTEARTVLTYDQLMTGTYPSIVDYDAYKPELGKSTWPTNIFQGKLQISGTPSSAVIFRDSSYVSDVNLTVSQTLPDNFNFEFVGWNSVFIPVPRGPQSSAHKRWEFIVNPGAAWDEEGDHGFSRAAIPFSLKEKGMDCTHNGVMMFLFKDGGSTSHAAMQITSESCPYLKINFWGLLNAVYKPGTVARRSATITAWDEENSHKIPVAPLSQLTKDFPTLGIVPSNFAIGDPSGNTLYGLLAFNSKTNSFTNYRSDCQTRSGAYPYCEVLDLPSFETANSMFASVALMTDSFATSGVRDTSVLSYVPECYFGPSGPSFPWFWGASFKDVLNMATGGHDSNVYQQDESSSKMYNGFFTPTDHASKIKYGCGAYAHRETPGKTHVFHSSDTYVFTTAMNNHLKKALGASADIYNYVVERVYKPLGMSQNSWVTRRTNDSIAQPFGGSGLTFYLNDFLLMGRLMESIAKTGLGSDKRPFLLSSSMIRSVMQYDPSDRGLSVADPGAPLGTVKYNQGYWARNVQNELQTQKPCHSETWVPYMSGTGPISIVMFPNNFIYYNFAHDGKVASADWIKPATEVQKFGDYCGYSY